MDYFPSAEFRRRARVALTGRMPVAVMLVFLASLPGLLTQVLVTIAEQPLQEQLYRIYATILNTGTIPDVEAIMGRVLDSVSTTLMLAWGMSVLAWLVTPFLTLGLLACLLRFLRGGECTWQDVLCRRGCFLRAIGVQIMVVLKIIVWMLPGYAVYGVLAILAFQLESGLLLYLSTMGVVAAAVLGIRAALHYSLSDLVLADRPETRIMDCIRGSISILRLRKMQFFLLMLSFIGWELLISLVTSLCSAITPVLGTTVSLAASLVLNLYIYTTQCAFYEEYKDKPCLYTKKKRA